MQKTRAKPAHLRLVEGSPAEASVPPSGDFDDDRGGDEDVAPPPSGRAPAGERSGRAARTLLSLSDGQLVRVGLGGDRGALEALYRRHVAFAIQLATRIEGSARDVEDVVHDAFIKAFTRLGDLAEPEAFRSWLGSIVVFAVRSRLRRQRLMNLLGLGRGADPVELDTLTSPEASPHTRAQLAQIYALLRTLPANARIAWTLRHVEGHELDMVARLTGCSLATVKRRIVSAQRFLDQHFVASALDAAPAGASEPRARAEPFDGALASKPTPTPRRSSSSS